MKEHASNQEDSLRTYIQTNKKRYNILDILDILDKDFSLCDRINHSEYYSKTVHVEWGRFCKTHPTMSKAELTEKALIYAMMTIPNKNVLIQIESSGKKQTDIQTQVQEMICIDDLRVFIDEIKDLDFSNVMILQFRRRELVDILKECKKVKEWSDQLSELIAEANDYFK